MSTEQVRLAVDDNEAAGPSSAATSPPSGRQVDSLGFERLLCFCHRLGSPGVLAVMDHYDASWMPAVKAASAVDSGVTAAT